MTTILVIMALCAFEILYSHGARIEVLFVLFTAGGLYHYLVRRVMLRQALIACAALGLFFSAVEVSRAYNFSLGETESAVAANGFNPASEFGAVFFSGYHLYSERADGNLPPREWPMLFIDFVGLVAPGDFTRWSPMYWYARWYFPDADVPPTTVGPIADSAIWGGEWDLLARSVVNGSVLRSANTLVRSPKGQKWWAIAIYVFCYATCVMALKYSVFYHVDPVVKTFIPTVLFKTSGPLAHSSERKNPSEQKYLDSGKLQSVTAPPVESPHSIYGRESAQFSAPAGVFWPSTLRLAREPCNYGATKSNFSAMSERR